MIGMRPYPGHPGLPQRRGPSGADTAWSARAVRIGLIHGSGDDDRSGQYRSPAFPIALSCMPTWWAGGDDRPAAGLGLVLGGHQQGHSAAKAQNWNLD